MEYYLLQMTLRLCLGKWVKIIPESVLAITEDRQLYVSDQLVLFVCATVCFTQHTFKAFSIDLN